MATQIEILSISPNAASLALYYQVASPIAAANDQERAPAGTALLRPESAAELQSLKDGTLFELLQTVSLSGMNKAKAKARIEATWAESEAEATREYKRAYRDRELVGKAFDGVKWS